MATPTVIIEGYLSRNTLFGWQRRYCQLLSTAVINLSLENGFLKVGAIELSASSLVENSNATEFCFRIVDKNGNTSVLLAATDMTMLEAWKEALQELLTEMRFRGSAPAGACDGHNSFRPSMCISEYKSRPIIYIKVVQARNLLPPASERTVDAYVKITLGSSSVKTIARKRSLCPDWGVIFSFDWERSMRFAKIEVMDEAANDQVLGTVQLPILAFLDGDNNSRWYGLSRKSKSSVSCGDIELEISCAGSPDSEQLVWQFFKEVQRTTQFSMQLIAQEVLNAPSVIKFVGAAVADVPLEAEVTVSADKAVEGPGVGVGVGEFPGFPLVFPSIECEVLEDFSTRVSIVSGAAKSSTRGVLFLTNYRLLFVTVMRAFVEETSDIFEELERYDVSMEIPIAGITSVALSNASAEVELSVRTATTRKMSFIFHNQSVPFDLLHSNITHIIQRLFSITMNYGGSHAAFTTLTSTSALTAAFQRLFSSDLLESYEAADSDEGAPAQRIFNRIKIRSINRPNELALAYGLNRRLLDAVRKSTADVPLPITADISELSSGAFEALLRSQKKPPSDEDASQPLILPMGWSGGDCEFEASAEEAMRGEASVAGLDRRLARTPLHCRVNLRSYFMEGWDVFHPFAEFRRMGVMEAGSGWKVSNANAGYVLCATYPAVLAVPEGADLGMLYGSASFRAKNRFPTLSWRNPHSCCTISRSSQPLPGISQARSHKDEGLLHLIAAASTSLSSSSACSPDVARKLFVIIDARPLLNAAANQVNGKGFENVANYGDNFMIQFMDIDNIHAVRKSYEGMMDASETDKSFFQKAEASGWLKHVRKVLKAANQIVHHVAYQEQSVLVHCSDGWDRTAKLTSLAMLLLDPFYRTLRGFVVLIEKEWMSFGHQFSDRCFAALVDGWKDETERSNVFPLWLDCVHQCLLQYPSTFEFAEDLLLFLNEHLYSGWFGNFLFNSERGRQASGHRSEMVSIWTAVFANQARFTNPRYIRRNSVVVPVATRQRIVVWNALFSHGSDKMHLSAWLHSVRTEEEDLHIIEAVTNGGLMHAAGTDTVRVAWAADKDVTNCRRCTNRFSMFRRKHHCRSCGFIFCEACCSERRILPTFSRFSTQRCCSDCARTLDEAAKEAGQDPCKRDVSATSEAWSASGI